MTSQTYELFMGRLGKNPELRYTKNSEPVCTLSVAVDRESENRCDWKRVVVWGRQAEHISVHLRKGNRLFVQGVKKIREYINKEGEQKSIEEISAKLIGITTV